MFLSYLLENLDDSHKSWYHWYADPE